MLRLRPLLALVLAAGAAGCASREVKYQSPDFTGKAPARVAVLPFDSEAVDLRAPDQLREMVQQRLRGHGYASVPLDEIDRRLRGIGISEGGQLRAYTPEQLGKAVEAEGLLYGVVEEFVQQNLGFVRRRLVRLQLRLVLAATGERLWESVGEGSHSKVALNKKEALRVFFEGIVVSATESALKKPLQGESEKAVDKLFRSLPRR